MPNLADLAAAKLKGQRRRGTRMRQINDAYPIRDVSSLTSIGRPLSQGTGHPGLAANLSRDNSQQEAERIRFDNIRRRAQEEQPTVPAQDTSAGILSKINEILGRERAATQGSFVNEYTPAQLAQIASGLQNAGAANAQLYRDQQGSINEVYDAALNRRAQDSQGVFETLKNNLSNIGGNLEQLPVGQNLAANSSHLDQVAAQNRAGDLAFGDKMATIAAASGAQLAQAAQQGLLTNQRWVPGDPGGFSEADKIRLGLLQDELGYERELSSAGMLAEQDLENQLKLKETATETYEHTNPLFSETLAKITNPEIRDEFARLYDLGGGPEGALKLLAEQPEILEHPGFIQQGSINPETGQVQSGFQVENQNLANTLEFYKTRDAQAEQDALNAALIELFRNLSPSYRGVPTSRQVQNKSTNNIS